MFSLTALAAVCAVVFEGCFEEDCKVDKDNLIIKVKKGKVSGVDVSKCKGGETFDKAETLVAAIQADVGVDKDVTCDTVKEYICGDIHLPTGTVMPKGAFPGTKAGEDEPTEANEGGGIMGHLKKYKNAYGAAGLLTAGAAVVGGVYAHQTSKFQEVRDWYNTREVTCKDVRPTGKKDAVVKITRTQVTIDGGFVGGNVLSDDLSVMKKGKPLEDEEICAYLGKPFGYLWVFDILGLDKGERASKFLSCCLFF